MLEGVSWNINGLRAIVKKGINLTQGLRDNIDVIALQEIKADAQIASDLLSKFDSYYYCVSCAEKRGYSGVAVLSKEKPQGFELLGSDRFDEEGRVVVAYFEKYILMNAYFPNSQEGGKRLSYKLDFCEKLLDKVHEINKYSALPLLICGDYNIAHMPIDLHEPERHHQDPGFLPQEREWMSTFLDSGYVDGFREFDDRAEQYSWWSYRTYARARNAGWRIDYACISRAHLSYLNDCYLMPQIMGSDHCPVYFELNI